MYVPTVSIQDLTMLGIMSMCHIHYSNYIATVVVIVAMKLGEEVHSIHFLITYSVLVFGYSEIETYVRAIINMDIWTCMLQANTTNPAG